MNILIHTNGSRVSISLILFPLRLRWVRLGQPCRFCSPDWIRLSLSSNCENSNNQFLKNIIKTIVLFSLCPFELKSKWHFMNLDASTFFSLIKQIDLTFCNFGKLGNPFNDVNPTFIRLSDSNSENSSDNPSIEGARQLSRFSSRIWKYTWICYYFMHYFSLSVRIQVICIIDHISRWLWTFILKLIELKWKYIRAFWINVREHVYWKACLPIFITQRQLLSVKRLEH